VNLGKICAFLAFLEVTKFYLTFFGGLSETLVGWSRHRFSDVKLYFTQLAVKKIAVF